MSCVSINSEYREFFWFYSATLTTLQPRQTLWLLTISMHQVYVGAHHEQQLSRYAARAHCGIVDVNTCHHVLTTTPTTTTPHPNNHSAHQHDHSFAPRRHANWEAPSSITTTRQSTHVPARVGRTSFVADDHGKLLGPTRPKSAFRAHTTAHSAPSRWPQPNPAYSTCAAATMGYKGIVTRYLPRATVPLRTVMVEGCAQERFA